MDQVQITNPDKVFYPDDGLTKADVAEHYRQVADAMVPHLRGRPLTLRRFPDGIDGQGWFQKEAADHFPDWVPVHSLPARGGGSVHHVVCDSPKTLLYLANQGTIEFHIWLSTVDSPENPDLLVIDIDPPQGAATKELRVVARRIRDRYRDLGLTGYVQATGGRGFHVAAPLDAGTDVDTVRELAGTIADQLAAADPDRLTTAQRKNRRGNRIFLDTNRNGYAQTMIAPYSLRARPGAAAATPLDWSELGRADPDGWPPATLRARLARKADPWRDLPRRAASADQVLSHLARQGVQR